VWFGIEKVMIYQFIPVMSDIVETSLKKFHHSFRSVVIDEVAEANAKVIDKVAEANAKVIDKVAEAQRKK
jgi:hypothetical protein